MAVASASTQSSLLTLGAAALNLTETYTYDTLSRLSTAGEGTGSWSPSYGYDTAGNYSRGNRYVSANSGFSLSASTPTVATNFDDKNRGR